MTATAGVVMMVAGMLLMGRVIVLNYSGVWQPRWYERQLLIGGVAITLMLVGAALAAE